MKVKSSAVIKLGPLEGVNHPSLPIFGYWNEAPKVGQIAKEK